MDFQSIVVELYL